MWAECNGFLTLAQETGGRILFLKGFKESKDCTFFTKNCIFRCYIPLANEDATFGDRCWQYILLLDAAPGKPGLAHKVEVSSPLRIPHPDGALQHASHLEVG
jgi:hypothetical protein